MDRSVNISPNPESAAVRIDVESWCRLEEAKSNKLHISEPREVAFYSRDADRTIHYGSRTALKKYKEPKLNGNLGHNIESYVPKSDGIASVDTIAEALDKSCIDILSEADVVTFRNNLNKLGGTPYNKRDDWEMDCTMVENTLFLEIRMIDSNTSNSKRDRFSYYGYRFEAVCTGEENQPVNANSEFCSIARLRIGNYRILMSAEIDCTTGEVQNTEDPIKNYLELKTMREVRTDRELSNMYRYRFPKYWVQSYLAGVRRIGLGLRSDGGELLAVKFLDTHKLHREAREHFRERGMSGCWEPFLCLNFIHFVLQNVTRACKGQQGVTMRLGFDSKTRTIFGHFLSKAQDQVGARLGARGLS